MAKIINFDSIRKEKQKEKETFEDKLNKSISMVEEELGIEDEPLTVLTEEAALVVINNLIDARDSIEELLGIMNYEESEVPPWEK